ncbi:MAG: tRNA (adenosine(37)-N6)-threonylcarbamoyltransferase complex ATPase subunit type 1 TsaE [Nocardioides sp.]|nr:tRNA (adenosine(37)-N6)-threonylcarbamoyltransferase complex ATPase subunit type 1 TsaE [Nocardioides sp.]
MNEVDVHVGDAGAAVDVLQVIAASFGARPPLDPPAEALSETLESISGELARDGGLLAILDGRPVGALLFAPCGSALGLRRVGVVPDAQHCGVAGALVHAAEEHAVACGHDGLRVIARIELPTSIAFWQHQGFAPSPRDGVNLPLSKVFPRRFTLRTAEETTAFGERLATLLGRGDLLILTGELGAGKTTFTRGLGAGLEVRGDITSPTFVIARVHPPLAHGPSLVHVDAYRLGSMIELDDLDLDTSLEDAVTVVEWGEGMAEDLSEDRLEIRIIRASGVDVTGDAGSLEDHDAREVVVHPVGSRWLGVTWPPLR